MNSCILMAQVVSEPELRSTQDGTSVSSMIVEFPSTREGEAPGTLQVEGWGNLAEEMKNSYHYGDRIIIEGRLSMNLIERDGIKEKRAKLVASKIYPMGGSTTVDSNNSQSDRAFNSNPSNVVDFAPAPQPQPETAPAAPQTATVASEPATTKEDWDEIPF